MDGDKVGVDKSDDDTQWLAQLILPTDPTIDELAQLLLRLYPFFLKPPPKYDSAHLNAYKNYFRAKEIFEQILYSKQSGLKKRKKVLNIPDKCDLFTILQPYFNYLEIQLLDRSESHLKIIWSVLFKAQESIKQAFFQWFDILQEKQLVDVGFSYHLRVAQRLESDYHACDFLEKVDVNALYQWIALLDSPNRLLRSVAAKCIGAVYTDWQDDEQEFQGHRHIRVGQMLDLLYQKQRQGQDVVGGFISGCCCRGSLNELAENKILQADHIDVKAWLIKSAIASIEYAPYNPAAQALWFYMHEYLDFDAKACHQLIDHKCYWLAMMCATESLGCGAYPIMQPVLARLQKHAPEAIAQEAERQEQLYLASL